MQARDVGCHSETRGYRAFIMRYQCWRWKLDLHKEYRVSTDIITVNSNAYESNFDQEIVLFLHHDYIPLQKSSTITLAIEPSLPFAHKLRIPPSTPINVLPTPAITRPQRRHILARHVVDISNGQGVRTRSQQIDVFGERG